MKVLQNYLTLADTHRLPRKIKKVMKENYRVVAFFLTDQKKKEKKKASLRKCPNFLTIEIPMWFPKEHSITAVHSTVL